MYNIIPSLDLGDIHHTFRRTVDTFASCNKYNDYKSFVIQDLDADYPIDIVSNGAYIVCDTIGIH